MKYIDSHCHINDEAFLGHEEEYVLNAKNKGVDILICVGYDYESSLKAVEIANRFDGVYAVVGIIPNEVKKAKQNDLELIKELAKNEKVVAIGEIGLDYHYENDDETKLIQKEYLLKQIELANSLNLPVVIHSRDADYDCFEILKNNTPIKKGVMHCYSGSKELAKEYNKLGFYISLAGPVTFKNAKTPKEVAIFTDLNYLLVETDSPYLTPHPYRGQRNESSYIPLIVEEIAKLKEISVEEVANSIRNNLLKLFNIKYER